MSRAIAIEHLPAEAEKRQRARATSLPGKWRLGPPRISDDRSRRSPKLPNVSTLRVHRTDRQKLPLRGASSPNKYSPVSKLIKELFCPMPTGLTRRQVRRSC